MKILIQFVLLSMMLATGTVLTFEEVFFNMENSGVYMIFAYNLLAVIYFTVITITYKLLKNYSDGN